MSNEYNDWNIENIKEHAFNFAKNKHFNQKRKWTNEQYINHPKRVADFIEKNMRTAIKDYFSDQMYCDIWCAAILHDTVEDTNTTIDEIKLEFNENISELVYWLTNISSLKDGNRKKRKQIDMQHILDAPLPALAIKLSDVYDNAKDIVNNEKCKFPKNSFSKIWLNEKKVFLSEVNKKLQKINNIYTEKDTFTEKNILLNKWIAVCFSLYSQCKKTIDEQITLLMTNPG